MTICAYWRVVDYQHEPSLLCMVQQILKNKKTASSYFNTP